MKILTSAEMREVDRRAIELGVPVAGLMENAGRAVSDAVVAAVMELEGLPVTIVCGRGNNGGDGLVAARHLANRGATPHVVLLGRIDGLRSELVQSHALALRRSGITVDEVTDSLSLPAADIIVDAIFGTGFRPPATGLEAAAIDAIERARQAGTTVVAVDIPSGLDADHGRVVMPAASADHTVTFAATKPVHWLSPAAERCGRVHLTDIAIPRHLVEDPRHLLTLADHRHAARLLPQRSPTSHKGTFGHLLVVAGSRGKTGAAVLAARAALRAGVGLVTVATPDSCRGEIACGCPEAMTEPLLETSAGGLAVAAGERILELAATRDAVAIGPGLGQGDDIVELVGVLAAKLATPLVVDADGLNAIARSQARFGDDSRTVLTPHPGEAARLLECEAAAVNHDRLARVREIASSRNVTCALKGHRTLTADASGRCWLNPTGNPGLATAGTGDVLTGVLGALLAAGLAASDAATAAVHVHGLAGDLAAARLGQASITAGDVIEHLAAALRRLEQWR